MTRPKLGDIVYQFVYTGFTFRQAWPFIQKHQLWKGLGQYSWMVRLVVVAGLVAGLRIGQLFWNWFSQLQVESPLALASNLGGLATSVFSEGYHLFTAGYMKYIILILMEVLVYHFMQRSLCTLLQRPEKNKLEDFLHAQIRMIKISFRSWVMELIATIFIGIALGILGWLSWLEPVLIFGVQCYYLGFAIIDNYHEQFGLSIDESAKKAREYIGIALSVGVVLYVILLAPLVGAFVGPIVASVTATLVMVKLSDLHLAPPEPVLEAIDPSSSAAPEEAPSQG